MRPHASESVDCTGSPRAYLTTIVSGKASAPPNDRQDPAVGRGGLRRPDAP